MDRRNENFIIKWYHCFINPNFFIRGLLFKSIKNNAPLLSGNLLDFGCGSKPYKDYFINATSYIGLDIEVSGHDHKNEQIDVYYDGKIIPFEDNHFDNVFATEVFEHVFNIDEVLPEIKRVLKPGGSLLITCPFLWPEHEQPYDFARYTSFGISHVISKHGFEIKKVEKTGNFLVGLAQLLISYVYIFLPKKPYILYLVLHQIFILPLILITALLNFILPNKLKKNTLYLNNVVLAIKK